MNDENDNSRQQYLEIPVRESTSKHQTVIGRGNVDEDRLLTIQDENLNLKRQLRKGEDRIRQLATKLVRLMHNIEKGKHKKNKDEDILMQDQKLRIEELEGQIYSLRSKLSVARQQLGSYTKLIPSNRSSKSASLVIPDSVTRLLLDAKGENHVLKEQIKLLQDSRDKANEELVILRGKLQIKEAEHMELSTIKDQLEIDEECKQRKIAENIQLIRLQRDSKRTSNWLATYEAQLRNLEANYNQVTEKLRQAEDQLTVQQEKFRLEQEKQIGYLKQVEELSGSSNELKEIKAQLLAIQEENKILKEANVGALAKSLDASDKSKELEELRQQLGKQISEITNKLQLELKEKSELLSALTQEKAKSFSLEQALGILDKKYSALSSQLIKVSEEMAHAKDVFTRNSNDDIRRESASASSTGSDDTGATYTKDEPLLVTDETSMSGLCKTCQQKDNELAHLHDQIKFTKSEIAKCKELLKIQIEINKGYQDEIEALTIHTSQLENIHEQERAELLKIISEKNIKVAELEEDLATQKKAVLEDEPFVEPNLIKESSEVQTRVELVEQNNNNVDMNPELSGSGFPEVIEKGNAQIEEQNTTLNLHSTTIIRPVVTGNEIQQAKLQEGPSFPSPLPTLHIEIYKFTPSSPEQSFPSDLFITLENSCLHRQYSPIVKDGNFNLEVTIQVDDTFTEERILIQLHEPVGRSDSQIFGFCVLPLEASENVQELKIPVYPLSSKASSIVEEPGENDEESRVLGYLLVDISLQHPIKKSNDAIEDENVEHVPAIPEGSTTTDSNDVNHNQTRETDVNESTALEESSSLPADEAYPPIPVPRKKFHPVS